MEKIIFEAINVNGKKRSLFSGNKFALENINFQLPTGYIMGIIGENGAGKTTFFNYVMNERKKYHGQFLLVGEDISKDHVWTMNNVGFVSEENQFIRQRTIKQNAELLGPFYECFDMELFLQILDEAGVPAGKNIFGLSKGENMKFQLAFAVAHNPKLLLVDEATAGMDMIYRKEFYRLLRRLLDKREISVIMSSHLEDDIQKQFDYIGYFEKGRLMFFKENELN